MKEQEEKNLEVESVIAKTEQYIQKNKKTIITVACIILGVALAIWAYIGLIAQPRQERAAESMYAAEQLFEQGDFQTALDGNDDFMGFTEVIDKYGCTKSGRLAKYYAGICQLNLGKYEEAIDLLKSYKCKDAFTGAEALMLTGDAYAELDKAADAASYYEKAAKKAKDNFIIAPIALWKAGMMQLKLDKKDAALSLFQQIKDNYPDSPEWSEVDKYIAFAENK